MFYTLVDPAEIERINIIEPTSKTNPRSE